MSILTAILSQWRAGLYGLLAAGLLIAGWQANAWRTEAREADTLRKTIAATERARKAADEARALAEAQLMDMQESVRVEVREVIKRVPIVVNNSRECDLGLDALRLLNSARGHGPLPTAAGGDIATR